MPRVSRGWLLVWAGGGRGMQLERCLRASLRFHLPRVFKRLGMHGPVGCDRLCL